MEGSSDGGSGEGRRRGGGGPTHRGLSVSPSASDALPSISSRWTRWQLFPSLQTSRLSPRTSHAPTSWLPLPPSSPTGVRPPPLPRLPSLTRSPPGNYYAVQKAMTLGSKAPEANAFLFSLMDKLELVGPVTPAPSFSPDAHWNTDEGADGGQRGCHRRCCCCSVCRELCDQDIWSGGRGG